MNFIITGSVWSRLCFRSSCGFVISKFDSSLGTCSHCILLQPGQKSWDTMRNVWADKHILYCMCLSVFYMHLQYIVSICVFLGVTSFCVDQCMCPPLSGQGFGFRPENHQSTAGACCWGRPGKIGVQGAGLPVQRLQSYGPCHIALDRTGAGSPL